MESVAAWGHLLWLALAVVAYFAGRKLIEQAARGIVDERLETLKAGFAEDLEQKRAGFTAQIERQKAEAAGELEEKKSELGKLSTVIQHNLQQEIIRSELRIRSLHKVYPVLSKKFHDALGAANHAITPMSIGGPDYDKLSEKELAALLEQYRLGDHDRRELQDEMASGRGRGQIFFKLDRRKRFAEAFNARTRAHNYMLVKRLYLSDEVLALAKKVDQGLVSPLVEAQMFYEYGPNRNAKKNELNNAQDETNALGEVLEQLDKQMRSERLRALLAETAVRLDFGFGRQIRGHPSRIFLHMVERGRNGLRTIVDFPGTIRRPGIGLRPGLDPRDLADDCRLGIPYGYSLSREQRFAVARDSTIEGGTLSARFPYVPTEQALVILKSLQHFW